VHSSLSDWPTEDDILHFEECGWATSPFWIPEDLLTQAAEAVEAYYLGERDHLLPLQGGFLDWHAEDGDGLRLNDYVSLQSDVLRELVCWPDLGRAAAALMRADRVRLFHDQLVSKPPAVPGADTTVGWHTDKSYWKRCSSERMLTAWIPFHDCSEDCGPLAVVDGSHKWHDTEWMNTFVLQNLPTIESRLGRPVVGLPLLLKRGQVSFHHSRTVHGSFPNRTSRIRTALAVHMQDGENRYRRLVDGSRIPGHINDLLCRALPDGDPDYADPSICPTLWPVQS
jgi:hypothetical protein